MAEEACNPSLCPVRPRKFPGFEQFFLQTTPATIREFSNLFLKKHNGRNFEERRLIWVTADTFVTPKADMPVDPCFAASFVFTIELERGRGRRTPTRAKFTIYSESKIGARWILKLLFETFSDDVYTKIGIINRSEGIDKTFPGKELLEAYICQNPARWVGFCDFEFNGSDCRVLTTTGNSTKLFFFSCIYPENDDAPAPHQDGSRGDASSSIFKLHFMKSFPKDLMASWNLCSKMQLHFHRITFTVDQCRALASADLQVLKLDKCVFGDGGESMAANIRAGCGPRGIIFGAPRRNAPLFDSAERCLSVITALQDNERMEGFTVHGSVCKGRDCVDALAAAVRRNKVLTRLGYSSLKGEDNWQMLLDAVADHPALRIFKLTTDEGEPREDLLKALIEMAWKSNTLEHIYVENCPLINEDVFSKRVKPMLVHNRYRQRFMKIRKVDNQSMMAGIVAAALARLNNNPALVYTLLCQNIDCLIVQPDETPEKIAAAINKKRHANSLNDTPRKSQRTAEKDERSVD